MDIKNIKRAQRDMVMKAIDELYDCVLENDLSTLTLELNYNPYNMGYKINKTHHTISYEEQFPSPNTNNRESNS
jgi:hypothetical protein